MKEKEKGGNGKVLAVEMPRREVAVSDGKDEVFVVELGFSAAKWIRGDRKGRIDSAYLKTREDGEGRRWRGDRYIVGRKALSKPGSAYFRDEEELVEFYPLFAAACADKACITSGSHLAVGLPYDAWKVESAKKRQGQVNVIDALEKNLMNITVDDQEYTFSHVHVFPQGLGGVIAFLNERSDIRGMLLGIDIGFFTIIYTLYSRDEDEIIYGRTLYKKGVTDLAMNKLLPEIKKHFPSKPVTPIEMNLVMESRAVPKGFDQIDVGPEIDRAAAEYIEDLLKLIIGDLKEYTGFLTFNTVVFFGGGAKLIGKDTVTSSSREIVVMDDPEFANARGFKERIEKLIRR